MLAARPHVHVTISGRRGDLMILILPGDLGARMSGFPVQAISVPVKLPGS